MDMSCRATWCVLALIGLIAMPADALTKEDVLELVRAGVAEDAIVARIQTEKPCFRLTIEDLLRLSREGVGDKVLKAMMSSGAPDRNAAGAPPSPDAESKAGNASTAKAERDPAVAPSPIGSPDSRYSRFDEPQLDRLSQVTTDIQRPLSTQVQRMLNLNPPHCLPRRDANARW
jgi:hypothetical protein